MTPTLERALAVVNTLSPPERQQLIKILEQDRAELIAKIHAARGSFAHVPGSVDEFIQNKQEEIELENRRWRS